MISRLMTGCFAAMTACAQLFRNMATGSTETDRSTIRCIALSPSEKAIINLLRIHLLHFIPMLMP